MKSPPTKPSLPARTIAKVYASTLWRMAQEMRMPEHVVVAPGAMLTRKQISVRIERLLDETPLGRRYIGAAALAISIVALTGVAALAATAPPIVLAEAAPIDEPSDAASPAAPPQPAEPTVVPIPALPKTIAAAAAAASSAAADSREANDLGQKIQAEVQRGLGEVTQRRIIALKDDGDGPVSRDLLRNCIGCDFSHRDLHGMDFSKLSLIGDDFSYADLRGTNFHAAKLTGVDLSHSNLDDADLSDSLLRGVDLGHASMHNTNTSGIRLIGSSLP